MEPCKVSFADIDSYIYPSLEKTNFVEESIDDSLKKSLQFGDPKTLQCKSEFYLVT